MAYLFEHAEMSEGQDTMPEPGLGPDRDEYRARLVDTYVRSGAWLDRQVFPPKLWSVPGIIPSGSGVLASPPKIGKSYFVYGVGLAVAAGTSALGGIMTSPARPVLYLALEDGDERMQRRRHDLIGDEPMSPLFEYVTLEPRTDVNGQRVDGLHPDAVIPLVEGWLARHGDANPLVIIDTLTKALPTQARQGETEYRRDYRVGSRLKALADAHPGSTVLVVHHTRKMRADDFIEEVSGTNGLVGAADFVLMLRRERSQSTGTLAVTGRDVAEAEYALILTGVGRWKIDGTDLAEAAKNAVEVRATTGLAERSVAVVEYVIDHPEGVTPKDVAAALGMSNDDAGKYLRRALEAGRIDRPMHGFYTPVRSVRVSEADELFGHSDGSDTVSEDDK